MTTTTYRTPQQIAAAGFKALLKELGPGGVIEFVHQYEKGEGNYTEERRKILKHFRLEDLKAKRGGVRPSVVAESRTEYRTRSKRSGRKS